MESKIIKGAYWMLSSFFLLALISRLFSLFLNVDLHFFQLMSITFLLGGLCCLRKISIKGFDIVVIIYLLYMMVNGLVIDYRYHGEFVYRALLAHVFPVACYFCGRYLQIDIGEILKKMKYPLLFAMICGIAFYFLHPAWYVFMKESQLRENASAMTIGEVYRLSSFWGHPYALSYATFLYSIFITNKLILGIKYKRELYLNIAILFVCIIVLMLAQLRVTIVIYVLGVFYMILFSRKESIPKKIQKILVIVVLTSIFAFLFLHIATDSMDYITNHMLNLTEENSMTDRFEHTSGGITSYSLFGDGLGRYGYPAREHNMWAIVDQEFQCHTAELGYVGLFILYIIILFTTLKCIGRPSYVMENIIILFFVVSMLGASVLSNHHQYNYIFWYTLGLIWSKRNIYRKNIL